LPELFEESFRRYEKRAAFNSMGFSLTYGRLEWLSRNLAAWLQDRGLHSGAHVAIMLPNCLAYPVALTGVLRAGAVVVNVNPMYTIVDRKKDMILVSGFNVYPNEIEDVVATRPGVLEKILRRELRAPMAKQGGAA
jgi:acyl-CoA synthetase (AMP-forming)/AMP-acid ligase II